MLVHETWIDKTDHCVNGESDYYEPYTTDVGKLFRAFRKDYGRCIGKAFIEVDSKPKQIGWVFQKRVKYDDCNETFLLETWVDLHDSKPTHTVQEHFHFIN